MHASTGPIVVRQHQKRKKLHLKTYDLKLEQPRRDSTLTRRCASSKSLSSLCSWGGVRYTRDTRLDGGNEPGAVNGEELLDVLPCRPGVGGLGIKANGELDENKIRDDTGCGESTH